MKSLLFFNDWKEISCREEGNNKAAIYTADSRTKGNFYLFFRARCKSWKSRNFDYNLFENSYVSRALLEEVENLWQIIFYLRFGVRKK